MSTMYDLVYMSTWIQILFCYVYLILDLHGMKVQLENSWILLNESLFWNGEENWLSKHLVT